MLEADDFQIVIEEQLVSHYRKPKDEKEDDKKEKGDDESTGRW